MIFGVLLRILFIFNNLGFSPGFEIIACLVGTETDGENKISQIGISSFKHLSCQTETSIFDQVWRRSSKTTVTFIIYQRDFDCEVYKIVIDSFYVQ